MFFDPSHLFFVRPAGTQIDDVGTRIKAAGLREVDVCIDESRNHPLAPRVDDLRIIRNTYFVSRSDIANAPALDHNRSVADGRPACSCYQGRALNDGDPALLLL